MPTYTYRFVDTGEEFEIIHSMKESAYTEYEGRPVEIVITGGAGIELKGWFPGKSISVAEKRQKALEKNPNHTTLTEYFDIAKKANPNSPLLSTREGS